MKYPKTKFVNKEEIFEWRLSRKLAKQSGTKLGLNPFSGNILIGDDLYAQPGTGRATAILGARARLRRKRK